jgi:Fe2+ transport system protein FeoA
LAGALTVADLREGEVFEVRRVLAEGELGRRLVEMGLSSGARGAVARMAPFRGPVQIDLLGYSLSLRRSEAYGVVVERIDPS